MPDTQLTMENVGPLLEQAMAERAAAEVEARKKDKEDAAAADDLWWANFRKRAAQWALGIAMAGGGGGFAYNKYVPDKPVAATQDDAKAAKRERTMNKLQIDNLGEEVVIMQDAQAVMPDYIIEAVRAEDDEALAKVKKNKPAALKKLDAGKAKKAQDAKKGKLLDVSEDEIEAALKEQEEAESDG